MARIDFEEKKNQIADAALKVFYEKGYDKSSLQDVSKEIGISKAGIYHYFKEKDEILGYILTKHGEVFIKELKANIEESKKNGLDQLELFKRLLRAYANHISIFKYRSMVLVRELHHLTNEYKEKSNKNQTILFNIIRDELIKIDNFNRKLNPTVTAFLIVGMLNSLNRWFREGKGMSLKVVIDQHINVILNGILKD